MRKELAISPKGQITLPKEVREALNLMPGDTFVMTVVNERLVLSPKNINFNDLAGFLGAPPNGPATLEQIDATVANEIGRSAASALERSAGKAA